MICFFAQAGTPPHGIVIKIIEWLVDSKTATGGGMMILMLALLYVVFPSVRQTVKYWLKRQEKEQDQEHDRERNFSLWLMKRTDQLEEERERRMNRLEVENTSLKDRLGELETKMRMQAVHHEEIQQRLRNLEWILLIEVCDALIERVNKHKEDIANRLKKVGQEALADAVKEEFEKLVEDVQNSFFMKNIVRNSDFKEEKQLIQEIIEKDSKE